MTDVPDVPDWPSVEAQPLHADRIDGYWIACEHPERLLERGAHLDARCPKCVLALKAHVLRNPTACTRKLSPGWMWSLADLLAEAKAWHAAQGTPLP